MKSLLYLVPVVFLGQSVPGPTPIAPTRSLAWDAVTRDVRGGTETVASYDVAVSGTNVDLNAGGVSLRTLNVGNVTEVVLSQLLNGLSDGPARLWVRARDAAGNVSTWSRLDTQIDSAAPVTPANIRVTVQVEVQVTSP